MKKQILYIGAALLLLCLGVRDVNAVEIKSFEWMRPIVEGSSPGTIFRVEVPSDIYARSHNFPDDIRIYDANEKQWPFFLEYEQAQSGFREVPADRVNMAWTEGPDQYLRLDLRVRRDESSSGRPKHNHVLLETSGRDFIRRVEVFGSEDQSTWALLGQGYLIDVSEPGRIEESAVHYTPSDYPFVQVRVFPNARNAMESFSINRADIRTIEPATATTRIVPHQRLEVPKNEQRPDAEVVLLDLENEHHPVESIVLRAEGGDYLRRVVVSIRDDSNEPWRYAGAGDIHRIGVSTKDKIPLQGHGRYIKCELYHYDDPPLQLSTIEVRTTRSHLVIESQSGSDPVLYYGGQFVTAPQYDLKSRAKMKSKEEWGLGSLGDAAPNPAFRKTGYGSWGKYLATGAVGLASLAVMMVLVRMFKRIPSVTEEG